MSHVSLCSGIGGLELALGTPDVFFENDPAPSEVLAVQFPDVPNLGDWTELDRFEDDTTLVSGGLPCQPLSGAGKRKGDKDERYLFDELIRILKASEARPEIFLENVRGVLFPRNRIPLTRFLRGLADLGYVFEWETIRASDIGCPHRRERWFTRATVNSDSLVGASAQPVGSGVFKRELGQRERTGERPGSLLAADPGRIRRDKRARLSKSKPTAIRSDGSNHSDRGLASLRSSKYGPAVERWESLTRPAPQPLEPIHRRLNPEFVEWMMGYPEGWIDCLPRAKALKALGNAVVPQQANLALTLLTR